MKHFGKSLTAPMLITMLLVLLTAAVIGFALPYGHRANQHLPQHTSYIPGASSYNIAEHIKEIVIVDREGALYQVMLGVLRSYGIDIRRFRSLKELLKLTACPKILVVNLVEPNSIPDLGVLARLRRCSLNGTHVLLALNNIRLGDALRRELFNESFP
ncbi:MAG: hypothetical protein DRO12_05365 [Thermoprotei archaeon]|nr:MAG: hypothetical protein DRO12_05365 [Thermoprotei archaeon]